MGLRSEAGEETGRPQIACIYHPVSFTLWQEGHQNAGILVNFINLKYGDMTWCDTYEEIRVKYPDTVFEEYWLVKEDVAKLANHEPIIKG